MFAILLRSSSRARMMSYNWHYYTTSSDLMDIRVQLMSEVKAAMKRKDLLTSTTLRAILSEVHARDKVAGDLVSPSIVATIIRRAVIRREDTAAKFKQALRQDLADKELQEAEILSKFLTPLLSEEKIDHVLNRILEALPTEANSQKPLGQILKEFYSIVDRSTADASVVKRRAEVLLLSKADK